MQQICGFKLQNWARQLSPDILNLISWSRLNQMTSKINSEGYQIPFSSTTRRTLDSRSPVASFLFTSSKGELWFFSPPWSPGQLSFCLSYSAFQWPLPCICNTYAGVQRCNLLEKKRGEVGTGLDLNDFALSSCPTLTQFHLTEKINLLVISLKYFFPKNVSSSVCLDLSF